MWILRTDLSLAHIIRDKKPAGLESYNTRKITILLKQKIYTYVWHKGYHSKANLKPLLTNWYTRYLLISSGI